MTYIRVRNTINVFHKKVLDVYFASITEETSFEIEEGEKSEYIAKKGDYLSTIANKNKITLKKLKSDNGLKSDEVKVGQKFIIKQDDKKIEKGKIVTFTKKNEATLGEEVYIIIKTKNLNGIEIEINVMQGKEKLLAEKDSAISLLKDDKKRIKTIVGEYAKNDKITNKDDFKDWAIAKITLAPKEEKTLESYTKSLKDAKDKKTYLFLAVNACTDIEDQTVFYKDGKIDKTNSPNYYLNGESEWLELGYCECCDLKLDKDGFFISKKISKNRISKLEKYNWKKKVQYIILHRTVTSSAKSALNSFKKGIGTHFLVGKDGETYQTATLNKTTSHIKNGYNSSTVGIEVVGMPYDKDGVLTKGYPDGNPVDYWDPVSTEQAKSVTCIVKALLNHYGLKISAIKNHEDLQAKAKDEGKTVYDAIINLVK